MRLIPRKRKILHLKNPKKMKLRSIKIANRKKTCHLILDREIYAQLRAGEIDPQDAFMGGKIEIEGDMQVAMQLALAVLSSE